VDLRQIWWNRQIWPSRRCHVVPPHWAMCHLAIGPSHVTACHVSLHSHRTTATCHRTYDPAHVIVHTSIMYCHIILLYCHVSHLSPCHVSSYEFPCHMYCHVSCVAYSATCHFCTVPRVTFVLVQLSPENAKI
jgi:hypothetical protein